METLQELADWLEENADDTDTDTDTEEERRTDYELDRLKDDRLGYAPGDLLGELD